MNSNLIEMVKNDILFLLKDNMDNERVKEELSHLSDKNYLELYIARKIIQELKAHDEYFIVRVDYPNLYISYLLGITDINPCDKDNYLPYELILKDNVFDLTLDIAISTKICKEISEKIFRISSDLKLKSSYGPNLNSKLFFKHLISIDDDIDLNKDFSEIDHDKVITINLLSNWRMDLINYFMKKNYDLPKSIDNEILNEETFRHHNFEGSFLDVDYFNYLLSKCEVHSMKAYEYLCSGVKGVGTLSFDDENITNKIIHDYPTTRERLYSLLIEYGLNKEDALEICRLTREGKFSINNELYNKIPKNLADYLCGIEYMWSLAPGLAYAKMDYLLLYFKLNYDEYYKQKWILTSKNERKVIFI